MDRDRRLHLVLMAVIVLGAVIHHCVLFLWYVDDAAISFAYSRNIANGEGVVPFVGAERVEGYSNPLWTFFLVPFAFVGLDLIWFVKWLQPFLVAPTVIVTYLAGREAFAPLVEEEEETGGPELARHASLIAPAVLAISALFATWTSSGLEIALMDLVMALAIWRSLVELRTGAWPVSALLWLGVTLSRPEAILYAAVAGFCAMVAQFRAGRGLLPTAKWLVTFFVPFGLYHAWRYSYFAWEFPNTYYAKLERRTSFRLLHWSGYSWKYTREFAYNMGWGLFVPVWGLGAVGHRGFRWSLAMAMGAFAALTVALASPEQRLLVPALGFVAVAVGWALLDQRRADARWFLGVLGGALAVVGLSEGLRLAGLVPSEVPLPFGLETSPPYLLASLALVAFVVALEDRRVPARPLVLSLCLAAALFALIAQWDWMKGYRWYAPAVVPGALLFAMGLHHLAVEVAKRLAAPPERRMPVAIGVVALALGLTLPPNVLESIDRVDHPDASPNGVRRRARYMTKVQKRLHLEERARDLEVDMGGHMYWTDFELVDLAGLIDVPMAHHKFKSKFVDEYIFSEQRPHFVHLHKTWEKNSRIKTRPYWRQKTYLEIPPYPTGRTGLHGGNHVRRDLVLPSEWPHDDRPPIALDKGVRVYGVHAPSEPPAGGSVYLELGVAQLDRAGQDDFRMWLTASNGDVVHRWDVDPGYGWVTPTEWMEDEVFVGRYSLALPEAMEAGDYDLSLTVIGEDGEPRRVEETGAPHVALGRLTVLSAEAGLAAAEADREHAREHAASGRCDEAERAWFLARKHQVADEPWRVEHEAATKRALAECWARRAVDLPRVGKVAALVRARQHDHWAPGYRAAASAYADVLYAEGLTAREAHDWEAAYRAFADAVAVDRSRSWARRYAEEARVQRLGLGPKIEKGTAKR